ncbi:MULTISPECIES: sugar ABC transporter ATP-binding protein [unclassified Crossiella]|uniref:sugar ABC transporter ATP-binding protein n=1 Tax=unclassified Crossiella TaxID=2620835 RepID=UPI001FFF23B7|nr:MULTISPECIES: sugar ABC transporter ATP-binding protein [unclassified Crossiella]MCK2243776.1 sugar ABC transporter ATP-binding protein [Crossiella sp. S99.2]MCK2257635.1 sugar ABC transporter ATP-binding protein [Crossiella sp. S99.1]
MTSSSDRPPVLALRGIEKSFGAVRALTGAGLELHPGRAHALLGENGAGKSTLIKVLGGVHRPDRGDLLVDGQVTTLADPAAARAAGIAVIHQEPALFPDLSLAENVFMGRQPRRRGRRIDHTALHQATKDLFTRLGVTLDPAAPARGLSIADQQVVEIAKALSFAARVIVMDEPTAALSPAEVTRLFEVTRALLRQEVAVLFVSHRLDEVFALCQDATVLRDGGLVWTGELTGVTPANLVRRMVGRDLAALFPQADNVVGEVRLRVDRLTREGVFTDISFELRTGEILALSGLVGAGRSEVARAIFGIDRPDAGTVQIEGRRLRPGSPRAAMTAGIGFVPEDRRAQGLVLAASIERNIALASLPELSRGGLLRRRSETALATDWALRLRLKYARLGDPVGRLSGGNQQKVVLAKWLSRKPKVLIVDEPTRGVDIGAKAEVHRLLGELAAEGVAILMISSELPEVLGLADRVLVMHEGRLAAELRGERATEENIALAATGQAVPA